MKHPNPSNLTKVELLNYLQEVDKTIKNRNELFPKIRNYKGDRCVPASDKNHKLKIGAIVTVNDEYEAGSPPRYKDGGSGYGGHRIGRIGKIIGYELDKGSEILEYLGSCEYAIIEDLETLERWTMNEKLLCLVSDTLRQFAQLKVDKIEADKKWFHRIYYRIIH